MELFDGKRTVTANEINKYCYCPYQWYYERLYGRKELRKLAAERNERLGIKDSRLSNFASGLEYHSNVKFRTVNILKLILTLAVFVVLILIFMKVKGFV